MTQLPAGESIESIRRQDIGVGDVILPAADIRQAVEAGRLEAPENLIAKLMAEFGICGREVEPDESDVRLITDYDPEREGGLGVMNRDTFITAYTRVNSGDEAKPGRASSVWYRLMTASVHSAKAFREWSDPAELNARLRNLDGRVRVVGGAETVQGRGLMDLREQIVKRLEGKERGVPKHGTLTPAGEPFMLVKAYDPETERPGLVLLDKPTKPEAEGLYLDVGRLYQFLRMTEGVRSGNHLGDKIRPRVINLVNDRITALRAEAESAA